MQEIKAVLLKIASKETPSTMSIRIKARVDHQANIKIFKLRIKFRIASSATSLAFTLRQYTQSTT